MVRGADPDYDEGDPVGMGERRRRIRPMVWAVPLAALVGYLGYTALTTPRTASAVFEKSGAAQLNLPKFNGYEQTASVAIQERDQKYDELLRQFELIAKEQDAQRRSMEAQRQAMLALANRKDQATTSQSPQKVPPEPRPHRDMGFTAYELPKDLGVSQAPLYALAPWATKLPCIIEPEANSDTGDTATCIVNKTVYDTRTGQVPLVPQHSTIGMRYSGQTLVFGNQRLPTVALTLVLPSGTTYELGESPVWDQDGTAGLVSDVDNHWGRFFGAVLIQGVLRGGAQAVSMAAAGAGAEAQVVVGTTQAVGNHGATRMGRWIDTRPTIKVHAGELAHVLLTRPLELPAAY